MLVRETFCVQAAYALIIENNFPPLKSLRHLDCSFIYEE